ncbi:MAG: NAD(P)H-dependent oxidoreductase [Janthinobacterium lividum]
MTNHARDPEGAGRHCVVITHPGPDSFDHAIANTYGDAVRSAGGEVIVRDLYAIGFDPVLKGAEEPGPRHDDPTPDVAVEIDLLRRSDVLVLVYPIWFGGAPAMLKGYVDRVLGFGVVPDAIEAGLPSRLLGGKKLLSFTTSATSGLWLDGQGQQASLKASFDRYLAHAFGMELHGHIHFGHITDHLTERFAGQYLEQVREEAQRTCAAFARSTHPASAEVLPS